MAGFITAPPTSSSSSQRIQAKAGSVQTAPCLRLSLFYYFCFAEHPEDKQLPVRPAVGNPSSICYHPQFSPTGPGVLKHAHLLQPCWWVWSLNTASSAGTVCSGLRWFLIFSLWYWYWSSNPSAFSLCVAAFVFPDFSLNSAEISSLQGFGSPGLSLGSMSAWQQHQLGQAALNSLVWVTHFQTKAHSPDALT